MTIQVRKKIKEMPKIERPREKLVKYGPDKLTDSELLAILLGSGKKGLNVIELAKRILMKFGKDNLPNVSYDSLRHTLGLGQAKTCQIVACFELGKRFLKDKKSQIYLIPEDIWKELKDIRNHKKEHFVVFYLDARNQEIKREIISVGSLNANLVHPREVFEPAVRNLAAQIILAHNHPSGDPEPSEDDLEINKRLVESGKILGIEVVDHIIVAKNGFVSFKEKGLI
ncbi:DNA repair protein RadC [candidate division WOR-3 bacterium]|nr:DNA repair protein RadC [candidate division WOR-3 bacterium]